MKLAGISLVNHGAQQSRFSGTARWLVFAAAVGFLSPAARANTTLFNTTGTYCTVTNPCWEAGSFGLLVGLPGATANLSLSGNPNTVVNIHGEVGIGAGSRISGGNNISGGTWDIIDFADPLATNTMGPLCPNSGSRCYVPATSPATDVRKIRLTTQETVTLTNFVTEAISDVKNMSDCWKSGGACQSGATISTTSFTAANTNVGVAPNGSQNISIYNVSSISSGKKLTVYGDTNDLVIINFTSNATFSGSSGIVIAPGSTITSDQILINFLANGTIGGDGNTYNATFIGRGALTLSDSITINGRVLGGSGTVTLGSNNDTINLNSPPDVYDAGVPEPSTWILMGTGMAGLLYFGRRRVHRS